MDFLASVSKVVLWSGDNGVGVVWLRVVIGMYLCLPLEKNNRIYSPRGGSKSGKSDNDRWVIKFVIDLLVLRCSHDLQLAKKWHHGDSISR